MSKSLFQSELIRAGAGTGKTYQLIEKIYRLFEESRAGQKALGRTPRLIVCTFTRKASQELKERLFEKAREPLSFPPSSSPSLNNSFLEYIFSSSLQIGTIDSILHYFLKKYAQEIELNPDFEISLNEAFNSRLFDSFSNEFLYKKHFSILKKIPYPHLKDILLSYYKYRLSYKQISFYNEEDFKNFQKERASFNKEGFKSQGLDYKNIEKLFKEEEIFDSQNFLPFFQEFQPVAEEFFIEFLTRKKNSSLLSVDDLLLFSCHLLDSHPELSKKINQDWDYWLIDEYQDTSLLQDQVIEKITRWKNVFCVGDPGQSIYSFRNADPEVFKKREKKLKDTGGKFKELKINRRSSSALISFYNDFFPEEQFMKFESLVKLEQDQKKNLRKDSQREQKRSCLSFFTYDSKEKAVILPTLLEYIKKLQTERGAVYSDIAVLCSKNKDLIEIADYLKEQGVPLMIYGSQSISKKRVVLDSLFLLKFLINPYDDDNLKALLRTPYFRLSDQELANSSYEYNKLNKKITLNNAEKQAEQEPYKNSFWAFIKDKYKESYFVESLSFHLENYGQIGLFESWKQALFHSGIMDLADFQDPMGSSSASLWKLISLVKKHNKSPLDLFYDLTEKRLEDQSFEEPPVQAESQFMELMTIHKSKGLQFKHVIVLDFSMDKAIRESSQSEAGHSIYDPRRRKMSFSVPLGARDKTKIKAYGHRIYNELKREDRIREKDNLFYVAMTRAEESLALFIPQGKKPEKNSWLKRVNYFKKVENLLNEKALWSLNSGVYDRGSYLLTVKKCQEPDLKKNSEGNLENQQLQNEREKSSSQSLKEERNITPCYSNQSEKAMQTKKTALLFKSSMDFIEYKQSLSLEKGMEQKPLSFQSRKPIKNTLLKTGVGAQLHFFLEKLFYFSPEELESLIENQDEKTKAFIRPAIEYVLNLKEPDLSSFFKKGFSEWSFKFKKENLVLQGQIDLWHQLDSVIHVIDYKSSSPPKKGFNSTKTQLIFYSWVLNEIYHPDQIFMYECYPLNETIRKIKFQPEDKKDLDLWISEVLKQNKTGKEKF